MNEQVAFIDREEEMSLIDRAVENWDKNEIICFLAEGGIGKTRLLQEIRNRYRHWDAAFGLDQARSKPLTVAVVNEFMHTMWSTRFEQGATSSATDLGINLIQTDAAHSIEKMIGDLSSVVKLSPDAIVIRLGTDERLRPGITEAIRAGIPVLTVDNYLPDLIGITTSITTDEHKAALRSCEQLVKNIQFNGIVVALFVDGIPMQERRKDLLADFLGQYKNNITLIPAPISMGEDMSGIAYKRTIELLKEYPHTKAIWVTWDDFGRGVVQALIDNKRTDIHVHSFDLLSDDDTELMSRKGSPWKATVTIKPDIVGQTAVQIAVNAACSKKIQAHYAMPMSFITQDELRERQGNWAALWKDYEPEFLPRLFVPDIIDFDDHAFRDEQAFAIKVTELIGRPYFDLYFHELKLLNEVKANPESSEELLAQHRSNVERSFIAGIKKITDRQRLILLIDTAEKAPDILHYVFDLISQINNVVVIFAGRPTKTIFDQETIINTAESVSIDIKIHKLPRLNQVASEFYLREKERQLGFLFDPELAEKLLVLTDGKPILIDLATEWLVRKEPLEWLTTSSLDYIRNLSDKDARQKQLDFEKELVHYIVNPRTIIDSLILLLARVYPLDVQMVDRLMEIEPDDAENLVKTIRSYVFVKTLPDGRITLHDEMRRLVNEYVWPEVDPDNDWKPKISKLAVEYLQNKIEKYQGRIWEFKTTYEDTPVPLA